MPNNSTFFFSKILIHSKLKIACDPFLRTFFFFFLYFLTSLFLQESYCNSLSENFLLKNEEFIQEQRNRIVSLLNSNMENSVDMEGNNPTSLNILEIILLNLDPIYRSEDFRAYQYLTDSDIRPLNINNVFQLLSKNCYFVLLHNMLYNFLQLNPHLISNFYFDTPFNYLSPAFTSIEKENILLVLDCEIMCLVNNLKESLLISEGGLIKNINIKNIFLLSRHIVMIRLLKNKVDSLGINSESFNIE